MGYLKSFFPFRRQTAKFGHGIETSKLPVTPDEIHLYYTAPDQIQADRLNLVRSFVEENYVDFGLREEQIAYRKRKLAYINSL